MINNYYTKCNHPQAHIKKKGRVVDPIDAQTVTLSLSNQKSVRTPWYQA